jgi:site-specific DNA-methyltransferase (adenine-specific)
MKNKYELILGDCLDEMVNINDKSINLILADLPYGTTKCKWDTIIPFEPLWEQYRRIIKPNGVIVLTASQPFTSVLITSNLEWYKYNWIWKKNKTTGFLLANYRPMKQTEDIVVFSPAGAAAASKTTGNMVYNPQGLIEKKVSKKNNEARLGKMLNQKHHLGPNNKLLFDTEYTQEYTNYPVEILEFGIQNDTKHPTQKPVPLMEYLIKTYSYEGDIVLDNVMGSGTTGIACLNTNRFFIGIEKDVEYFELAKNRIEGK